MTKLALNLNEGAREANFLLVSDYLKNKEYVIIDLHC